MRKLRSILFVGWLYATLGFVGLSYLPAALASPRGVPAALRAWTRLTLFGLRHIVGATVTIEGRENIPPGAALIAAKHQAMLDTMIPSLFLDQPAFVYKSELGGAPVVGWYLKRGKMIPVEREAHASAIKALLRASREAIAADRQIIIFPEGTRQELGAPPDYKPGIVALYRGLGLPVIPVALNTGMIWPPRGLWRSPGKVVIRILPAIPPGLPRDEFMRELQSRIETESEALLPPRLRRGPDT